MIAATFCCSLRKKGRCFVRSSSIWVPLFIAGAAAVTVAVVAQRQSRLTSKADEPPLSGRANGDTAEDDPAEAPRPEARDPFQTLDFDPDPETARGIGEPPLTPRERGEAYDAVSTDDLGAEWLARATEAQPAHRAASPSGEFDELTTLDMIDEEPLSLSEFGPDSNGLIESEAVLADRKAKELEAHPERPRPPPRVFDIAELLQDDEALAHGKRPS